MRTGAFPADNRRAWTLPKYTVPEFFYTVRDPYGSQAAAAFECISVDFCDTVRNRDRLQAFAFGKCPETDLLYQNKSSNVITLVKTPLYSLCFNPYVVINVLRIEIFGETISRSISGLLSNTL